MCGHREQSPVGSGMRGGKGRERGSRAQCWLITQRGSLSTRCIFTFQRFAAHTARTSRLMKIYDGPGGDQRYARRQAGDGSCFLKLEAGIVAESLMRFLGFLFGLRLGLIIRQTAMNYAATATRDGDGDGDGAEVGSVEHCLCCALSLCVLVFCCSKL